VSNILNIKTNTNEVVTVLITKPAQGTMWKFYYKNQHNWLYKTLNLNQNIWQCNTGYIKHSTIDSVKLLISKPEQLTV